ncbi:CHAD domain-containing protein [filamentous cyanobacterium LEGE 11480]|uniref:CHAD domain-containing protein n=1 Tax=Romeriopsis navalis LEGE 11480 TaxID=2777977 RepID=A0A928VPA6_9CYAN|nr:CHAD domain-containing protein [Romeriopsis navalis]MBE9029639.1 CHAD domain-containing protein [Romeriopsis navalis LEGE 11480]
MTKSIPKTEAQSITVDALPQGVVVPPITLGDYVYRLVKKQFTHMMREESAVLADQDPEPLHQMRINARRLRSTMELFEAVVEMPAAYQPQHLRKFNRTLGKLRNLDVVMARLQQDYYPSLPPDEQKSLAWCLKKLRKQRRQALKSVKKTLQRQSFSQYYEHWLKSPRYREAAGRSLTQTLPHLLMPKLAHFLAHPAWSISADTCNGDNQTNLHDLRKVVKHLRYQLEGVKDRGSEDSVEWIASFKLLQDCLGTIQDLAVLRQVIVATLPKVGRSLLQLEAIFHQQQAAALADWERLRQPYLQPQYQYQCYQRVLRSLQV